MRTLTATLIALMLFAMTPVAAGDFEDGAGYYNAGDYQKTFRLHRPLAEQGHALAQFSLGMLYEKGEGVPEDDAKAVYWYRKAAEQGQVNAQFRLGYMTDFGQGVPEDDAKAAHWYRKAAEQGHAVSQSNLGNMYYRGEGVLEDYVQAYAWWSIAATRGRKGAKKNKGIIKKKMTPAQIAEAQKLSSELWEKYVVPFK